MAREVLTAQENISPGKVSQITYTSINDNGAGYSVKSEGDLLFLVWNNGLTDSATITISSVAMPEAYERKGDISQVMAAGTHYAIRIPPRGFVDNGYINFAVSEAGADNVDVAIFKNM